MITNAEAEGPANSLILQASGLVQAITGALIASLNCKCYIKAARRPREETALAQPHRTAKAGGSAKEACARASRSARTDYTCSYYFTNFQKS